MIRTMRSRKIQELMRLPNTAAFGNSKKNLWFFSGLMSTPQANVVIIGGGIAGLALALSLRKHLGVNASVYEQAPRFGKGNILLFDSCLIQVFHR
jgi:NADPH-dependent 2,4-dienoyl-CoA reductase/sulfur reductase-like enzyme